MDWLLLWCRCRSGGNSQFTGRPWWVAFSHGPKIPALLVKIAPSSQHPQLSLEFSSANLNPKHAFLSKLLLGLAGRTALLSCHRSSQGANSWSSRLWKQRSSGPTERRLHLAVTRLLTQCTSLSCRARCVIWGGSIVSQARSVLKLSSSLAWPDAQVGLSSVRAHPSIRRLGPAWPGAQQGLTHGALRTLASGLPLSQCNFSSPDLWTFRLLSYLINPNQTQQTFH